MVGCVSPELPRSDNSPRVRSRGTFSCFVSPLDGGEFHACQRHCRNIEKPPNHDEGCSVSGRSTSSRMHLDRRLWRRAQWPKTGTKGGRKEFGPSHATIGASVCPGMRLNWPSRLHRFISLIILSNLFFFSFLSGIGRWHLAQANKKKKDPGLR